MGAEERLPMSNTLANYFKSTVVNLCVPLLMAPVAWGLDISVTPAPGIQTIFEGGAGMVDFFIFNNSGTSVAYVDMSTINVTCPIALGSPDITDFIICGDPTITTTGTLLPNSTIYRLGVFGVGMASN